uniref:Protein kinase domain-containing protein n=1 Tax=Steinernema glaseri TaxID=37863 RepID=A0A1I8AAY4_9BILA
MPLDERPFALSQRQSIIPIRENGSPPVESADLRPIRTWDVSDSTREVWDLGRGILDVASWTWHLGHNSIMDTDEAWVGGFSRDYFYFPVYFTLLVFSGYQGPEKLIFKSMFMCMELGPLGSP